jgi:hypothetical protein
MPSRSTVGVNWLTATTSGDTSIVMVAGEGAGGAVPVGAGDVARMDGSGDPT